MLKRGFTLIEVLVSGAILIIVTLAVVAISNSITQSTEASSDVTVSSNLAQQNLNLVTEIRDNGFSVPVSDPTCGNIWFDQACNSNQYGWYALTQDTTQPSKPWSLKQITASSMIGPSTALSDFVKNATPDQNSSPETYQLICIEAYGANDNPNPSSPNTISCNNNGSGKAVSDGNRTLTQGGSCTNDDPTYGTDSYCRDTEQSLNWDGNNVAGSNFYIPAGNAVKIKSVVVWQTASTSVTPTYKSTSLTGLITDWQSAGGVTYSQ
jgi:Tfp pilus assembly protein PilV